MQPQLVSQFRTELTLSKEATGTGRPAKITITCSDQNTAKQLINRLAPEATMSTAQGQTSSIYHPNVNNGKKPCGSLGPWMAVEGYDVESTATEQLERQRQAA